MIKGGKNIAMKVPPHQWSRTVAFYESVLGLPVLERDPASVAFKFGPNRLWIDRVEALSQAELWLELTTDDLVAADATLAAARVTRRDEIEELPDGFKGFWIANPAEIIHLVSETE